MPRKKPDLDALIEAMVEGDRTAEYPIKQLGARAVPALVRAMDDPRACRKTRWDPAILRIWEILVLRATPEIIARMAAFVDHDDPKIRHGLYGKLAWLGSTACAEALVRAWSARGGEDRKEIFGWVRYHAGGGRGRKEPGFVAALYDVISEQMSSGELGETYDVAETLLKLDLRRALASLTSPEVFRADNPVILPILIALESVEAAVRASALVPMMPALRAWSDASDKGGPPGAPYEVALSVLARSDPEAARPLVEEALRSDDPFRRERAEKALTIIEGVDDALAIVHAAVADLRDETDETVENDEGGIDFDLLDDVHANYYLAHEADEIIKGEGLNGYLFETPDRNVARTPEALEAIGALRAAESIREARALIRGLRPREGEDSSHQAMDRPEVVARVDELQAPFLEPEPGEEIPGLLRLYALRNPDAFRKPKKRTKGR